MLPIIKGITKTNVIWNTNVLSIDIDAEIVPLFNAVKKDDVNIENPANKKHNEQILIAVADNSFKSAFPLEKKLENVGAVNKLIVITKCCWPQDLAGSRGANYDAESWLYSINYE